jgi:hypothetical protein
MVEVTLETRRGKVVVVFDDQEDVLDAFAASEYRWSAKTWARQRSQLIRRARLLCAKIGTIRTVTPHSDKLNGKAVIACHKIETGLVAAGVYCSVEGGYFVLYRKSPPIHSPVLDPRSKRLLKSNWEIVAVYPK